MLQQQFERIRLTERRSARGLGIAHDNCMIRIGGCFVEIGNRKRCAVANDNMPAAAKDTGWSGVTASSSKRFGNRPSFS